ncbi:MAG TPA: alkaline phosphatase family protein [Anaerolineae bacterium]
MRRILGLVLIIMLTIVASLAETVGNNLWSSYRNYSSPYLADLPAGTGRQPVAQRVVVVLVRGLRLDDSRQMAALNDLRARGSDLVVQQEPPTYRLPAWETLFTGARAETHGVTTNSSTHAGTTNSIFSELQLMGQASALIGSQALGDVYGNDVQRFEVVDNASVAERDDNAVRLTQEVLSDTANPTRLVCVELTAIEDTMQNNPANNQAAISVTDTRIKTFIDTLDLSTNVLVILSDRGLTSRGTDGGAEPEVAQSPLVMAGVGIAGKSQAIIKAIDVAPTLAALLGAPMPLYAQGEVAVSALSFPEISAPVITSTDTLSATDITTDTLAPMPGALWASALQLTTFYENWSETIKQPRFAAELLRAQRQSIRDGDSGAYQKFVIDLNARADAASKTQERDDQMQRLPVAIGTLLFLLALIGTLISLRRWQSLIGAVVYVALWYALYTFIRADRFSLSMFAGSDPTQFMAALQRYSAALMLVVCVFVALTTGTQEDGLEAIATVLVTVLLIVCILAVQIAWFYFQWGFTYTWMLPDSAMLVWALTALTQISALSLRIVPELPNLPVPLVIAVFSLAIYGLLRNRKRPDHYGRLR